MNTITPQDFVAKWKRVTARERQACQEHFIDLCNLIGHQTPNDYDPSGRHFAFEMGANKTSGGQGWADVAKLGYFGWEYKGKDHDLIKAYDQLLRYRDALQNPPVLVVSDINNIIIRTNYTNLPTRTISLTLDDLLKPESLKILRAVFNNPDELKPHETVASVTEEAARQFAQLAGILRKYGEDPQAVAHFLIRLLFCLFAEDIGLLPEKLFPRLLDQTRRNARDFAGVLRQLFQAMQTGGFFGSERILHFNGGLFENDAVLELDSDAMDIIARIDALDWGAIEPSIFGTLFERGLDPGKRSQLGAHYTSRADITLIVEPVLMVPLRTEWAALQAECNVMKDGAAGENEKKRALVTEKSGAKLRAFADKIAAVRVLDPACGSGNFLYVALQLLLDLQKEVMLFSYELGAGSFIMTVSPAQLFGIEINEYAHELAQVTIWIGHIQWMLNNGFGLPTEPILKKMDNMRQMDAILAFDADGKAFEPQWPVADVIVGNPPFLGSIKQREELGEKYLNNLSIIFNSRIPPKSDFVCYWFEKASNAVEDGTVKRCGLIATQAIRKGLSRTVLDRIKRTGDIFMAYSNRPWILDGASIRVSIICFDNGTEKLKNLDGKSVDTINSDLSSFVDITKAVLLPENQGIAFPGTKKYGAFDIEQEIAQPMLDYSGNPNGKPNSDVIKPWVNGSDLVGVRRGMWIIDFGVRTPIEVASQYQIPFEYVHKYVKPERDKERISTIRENWWLFERQRPEMRQAIKELRRFIASPVVSKYRVFVWLEHPTIPDAKVTVFARTDDYFFGVLHSRLHEVWSLLNGARHGVGNDPTYNITTCFNTFPFPWSPGQEPQDDPRVQAVAAAAQELVEMRERWLNPEGLSEAERKKRTLTNLYNARPTWLALAHKQLDAAVSAAYGWPDGLSDEQILEKLLALNLERAGGQ